MKIINIIAIPCAIMMLLTMGGLFFSSIMIDEKNDRYREQKMEQMNETFESDSDEEELEYRMKELQLQQMHLEVQAMEQQRQQQMTVIALFVFMAYLIVVYIMNLVKIRLKSARAWNITGLTLSALIIVWTFLMINSGGKIRYSEIGYAHVTYCIFAVVAAFVGVNQVRKFRNGGDYSLGNSEILDDIR